MRWLKNFFKTFSIIIFAGMLGTMFVAGFLLLNLIKGLPEVSTLKNYHHEIATEVFSDDGHPIGEFTTERRYSVSFDTIPKHVIHAFLAAEDSKFYEHGGVDFTGILRAVISNLAKGRYAQGGSTITQQVARTLLLGTKKKELTRKIREMVLAFRMEKELTKNEILGLYLNEIYLGHGAYGIGAAAQAYFNKNVTDLTVAEAAMLAGLPQRPYEWDPFRSPHTSKKRQMYVIKRMVDEKFITETQAREAAATPLKLYSLQELNNRAAPYFVEYVRQYLMQKYGSENVLHQGFKVYTTVRYDFQKAAEKALDRGLRGVDKRLGFRGVAVHIDLPEKRQAYLETLNDDVLDKVTRVRILPAVVEVGTKKLEYDRTEFESPTGPYFGRTPVKEGEFYKGLVAEVTQSHAIAQVGYTAVEIPLSDLGWVKVKGVPVKSVGQVLRVGDVIDLKVIKIDRHAASVTASLEQEPEIQGALLSYEIQNGFVRAMVGGRDFVTSKFNRALQAKRQVGSTFKPIIYASALDKGYSPSSIVTDSPIVFKFDGALDADNQGEDWRPRNYEGKFVGDIPLRLALIRSMNIPTVKLLNELGVDYGIQYARTLGITAVLPRDLSIGLGSWSSSLEELTRAYAVFPRAGRKIVLNYIRKVVDGEGKVLEELPAEHEETGTSSLQAISPQTAYVITDMLKGVVREGTGHSASIVQAPVAGKTGTSNDHRDAWFVGFTPSVMTGLWLGYDNNKPLDPSETGGKAAAPIWADYMQNVVGYYPKNDFAIPDDVVFAYVDRDTGRLAGPNAPRRVRVAFKSGTVPAPDGSNIRRIGEPGSRGTTNDQQQLPQEVATPAEKEESSEFLREDYKD